MRSQDRQPQENDTDKKTDDQRRDMFHRRDQKRQRRWNRTSVEYRLEILGTD